MEDSRNLSPDEPEPVFWTLRTKILLGLVVALAVGIFLVDQVLLNLQPGLKPID